MKYPNIFVPRGPSRYFDGRMLTIYYVENTERPVSGVVIGFILHTDAPPASWFYIRPSVAFRNAYVDDEVIDANRYWNAVDLFALAVEGFCNATDVPDYDRLLYFLTSTPLRSIAFSHSGYVAGYGRQTFLHDCAAERLGRTEIPLGGFLVTTEE